MRHHKREIILFNVIGLLFVARVISVSGNYLPRERRSGISDQRLAELETILGLKKLNSVTRPVGSTYIDFNEIGRRKRAIDELGIDSERHSPVTYDNGRSTHWRNELLFPVWRKRITQYKRE